MNAERRARYLEKVALREAQKAMRRHPGSPVTRDELMQLRVQSVSWWLRGLVALAGAGFIVLALAIADDHSFIALLAGGFGFILLLCGLIGRRQTVDVMLQSLGDGLAEVVIEAVFRALD